MGNSPDKDKPKEPEPPKEPGLFGQLSNGYDQLVNAIIRPPRAQYQESQLGPSEFSFVGKQFRRSDFDVVNPRGMNLKCSHWEPVERPMTELPCVIYMHGNSSCRVEAVTVLSSLLSGGMTVLAMDFAGSGLSDGEYVSLGYYEKDDLAAVVDHLRQSGSVSTLGLWGRSMGAATALQHGDRDPSIAGMVIDSGFTSLEVLSKELVDMARNQGHTIPGFAVSIAMSMIKSSVKKKAKFKVEDLNPIAHVDRCFIPAIFVHGREDNFIAPHHSEEMHQHYAGDKQLMLVDGDHNSARPGYILDTASIFLHNALRVDDACCPDLGLEHQVAAGLPPWRQSGGRAQGVAGGFLHSMEYESFESVEMPGQEVQSSPAKESVASEVQMMVDMGMDAEQAENALLMNHGNVDLALAYLFEHQADITKPPPVYTDTEEPDATEQEPNPSTAPDTQPAPSHDDQSEAPL
eukprot:TRINITY_DN3693_c0_g1_i3.p1 TRINITY_DN3693_c0_g1~~TRINITY_DN3693_c0_g1_i3.p1  ORF type:complete len:461 (-),score=129.65 TRINITY_DN3693_c0_g1_i3:172-1554(-)